MNHRNPIIIGYVLIANTGATVGRTVVDKDDFIILVVLVKDRIDAKRKIPLNIVDRYDNGYQRLIHKCDG